MTLRALPDLVIELNAETHVTQIRERSFVSFVASWLNLETRM
jgi:hypothetical protein